MKYAKVLACADIKGEKENHKLKKGITEHRRARQEYFSLSSHIYINVAVSDGGLGINIGDMKPFLLWA